MHLGSARFVGHHFLVDAALILLDDALRCLHYGTSTAVVVFKKDSRGTELLLKAFHVGEVGAAPTVDALVCVTYHEHRRNSAVLRGSRQQLDQRILRHIRVLPLVDQNVVPTLPQLRRHRGLLLEETQGEEEDVVKVDGIAADELLLIQLVYALDRLHELGVPHCAIALPKIGSLFRRKILGLQIGDCKAQRVGLHRLFVYP